MKVSRTKFSSGRAKNDSPMAGRTQPNQSPRPAVSPVEVVIAHRDQERKRVVLGSQQHQRRKLSQSDKSCDPEKKTQLKEGREEEREEKRDSPNLLGFDFN